MSRSVLGKKRLKRCLTLATCFSLYILFTFTVMNRNAFLKFGLAASSFFTAPFLLLAQAVNRDRGAKAIRV
jgi:hypothetical protein